MMLMMTIISGLEEVKRHPAALCYSKGRSAAMCRCKLNLKNHDSDIYTRAVIHHCAATVEPWFMFVTFFGVSLGHKTIQPSSSELVLGCRLMLNSVVAFLRISRDQIRSAVGKMFY